MAKRGTAPQRRARLLGLVFILLACAAPRISASTTSNATGSGGRFTLAGPGGCRAGCVAGEGSLLRFTITHHGGGPTTALLVVTITALANEPTGSAANNNNASLDLDYVSRTVPLLNSSVATFSMFVEDDTAPELDELFLLAVRLPDSPELLANATLRVPANDDPFGSVGFLQPRVAAAEGQAVSIPVGRVGAGGRLGDQTVSWSTASRQVRPSSGRVVLTAARPRANITLVLPNDTLPELPETVVLLLDAVSGGARLDSSANSSLIAVAASDDPFGRIGFSQPVYQIVEGAPGASGTPAQVLVPVGREGGTLGNVTVGWRLTVAGRLPFPPLDLAADVLSPLNGTLQFAHQSSTPIPAAIAIQIQNDATAEPNEALAVELAILDARPNNGTAAAAVLDPARSRAEVVVLASDGAQGAFQFAAQSLSTSITEPGTGSQPVSLLVERLGPSFGAVNVTWVIAVSRGVVAEEFAPASGLVRFADGQTTAMLAFELLADGIPELAETGTVTLTRVAGEFAGQTKLGDPARLTATLSIPANDDPDGVFGFFTAESRVQEPATGVRAANFLVTRSKGAFSSVTLAWTAVGRSPGLSVADLAATSGVVQFNPNQRSGLLFLGIAADSIDEENELLELTLTIAAGGGRVQAGRATLRVTIALNGFPYGLFGLAPPTSIVVPEPDGALRGFNLTITRGRSQIGVSAVRYSFLGLSGGGTVASASSLIDYVNNPGTLRFGPGEAARTITIFLLGDDVPEADEGFLVRLSAARAGDPLLATAGVGVSSGQATLEVVIPANDMAGGVFGFAPLALPSAGRTVHVAEGPTAIAVDLVVARSAGLFGSVDVDWAATGPGVAQMFPSRGRLTFAEGQAEGTVRLQLVADSIPEPEQELTVTLLSAVGAIANQSSVAQGAAQATTLVIAESDDPFGVFGFPSPGDTTIPETSLGPGPTTPFQVQRSGGAIGAVVLTWHLSSSKPGMANLTGEVAFAAGQRTASIDLPLADDDEPELEERLILTLLAANGTARIDPAANSTTITIPENDDARGLFGFAAAASTVRLEEGQAANLTVVRSRGRFGATVIAYTLQPTSLSSGSLRSDLATSPRVLAFAEGQATAQLTVLAIDDAAPEFDESFVLALSIAQGGGGLASGATLSTVTIGWNDSPLGSFGFAPPAAVTTVREGDPPLRLMVLRRGPSSSTVTLGVQARVVVGALPAAEPALDFTAQPSKLVFLPGVAALPVDLVVVDDGLPEPAEQVTLALAILAVANPQGANATLFSPATVTVTVLPSDDAVGVFRLAAARLDVFEGGGAVEVVVNRERGAFGEARVAFRARPISAQAGTDFVLQTPTPLLFVDQQRSAVIRAHVPVDATPELTEAFAVDLLSASGGARLGDPNSTIVTIAANEGATGLFALANASSINGSSVAEGDTLSFVVERTAGTLGSVNVSLVVEGAGPVAAAAVAGGEAITLSMARLEFLPGETHKTVRLLVVDDARPEDDQTVCISLANATNGAALLPFRSALLLTIGANDAPYGIVEFAGSLALALGPLGSRALSGELVRRAGSFRSIAAVVRVLAAPAANASCAPQSLVASRHAVSFATAQTAAALTIPIGNATFVPAGTRFCLQLVDAALQDGTRPALQDGRRSPALGASSSQARTVSERFANGVAVLSVGGTRLQEGQQVELRLARRLGQFGRVRVAFQTTAPASTALLPASGVLELEDAQPSATVNITVGDDAVPELEQSVLLTTKLLAAQAAAVQFVGPATTNITVLPSDDPHGVLAFAQNGTSVGRLDGTVCVRVARSGGAIGPVSAAVRAVSQTAVAGIDFTLHTSSVAFAPGVCSACVAVLIRDMAPPAPSKLFSLVLSSPTGGARLSAAAAAASTTSVAIQSCAHCTIGFSGPSPAGGVTIEGDSVALPITRRPDAFGTATVQWRVSGGSGAGLTPSSGSLTLLPGVTRAAIAIQVTDDTEPEPAEEFVISLTAVQGEASLGSATSARLRVAPSDYPLGLFQLVAVGTPVPVVALEPARAPLAPAQHDFVVRRATAHGDDGTVVVAVGVHPPVSLMFDGPRGSGTGAILGIALNISVDACGSLCRSGSACLGFDYFPAEAQCIQRAQNQTKPALLQDTFYALDRARSARFAVPGRDFAVVGNTTLLFAPGVTERTVTITLLPDAIPELDEAILLRLSSVAVHDGGGPRAADGAEEVGIDPRSASSSLTILENDDARGLFAFELPPGGVEISEGQVAAFAVRRAGGVFGPTRVAWATTAGPEVVRAAGSVDFVAGQRRATVHIEARQDMRPEATAAFAVRLVSASAGRVAAVNNATTLRILASDDPGGIVGFLEAGPVFVSEPENAGSTGRAVTLTLLRGGGTVGAIAVAWSVSFPDAPPGREPTDVSPVSGVVLLADGQAQATLAVSVLPDDTPELEERAVVALATPTSAAFRLQPNRSRIEIRVPANDDPNGVIGFAQAAPGIAVEEQLPSIPITVVRRGGALGTAAASLSAINGTALAGVDFALSGPAQLVFLPGEREKVLQLSVLDDGEAEPPEAFQLALSGPEVAPSGANSKLDVVIAGSDNEFEFGRFAVPVQRLQEGGPGLRVERRLGQKGAVEIDVAVSLAPATAVFQDNSGAFAGTRQSACAARCLASPRCTSFNSSSNSTASPSPLPSPACTTSTDPSALPWRRLSMAAALASSADVALVSALTVAFADGQRSAYAPVVPVDDALPELDEVFLAALVAVRPLTRVTGTGPGFVATPQPVVIAANDNATGVLSLAAPGQAAAWLVESGQLVARVLRSGLLNASVAVAWSVADVLSGLPSADVAPNSGRVQFSAGQASAMVVTTVVADGLPELNETVVLSIAPEGTSSSVEAARGEAVYTIAANDDFAGVFRARAETNPLRAVEGVPTAFTIERGRGALSAETVQWELLPPTSAAAQFAVSAGAVEFAPGQNRSVVALLAVDDLAAETDTPFSLRLTPLTGARLDTSASSALSIVESGSDDAFSIGNASTALLLTEGQRVTIPVHRLGLGLGAVDLPFEVVLGARGTQQQQVLPSSGVVRFGARQAVAAVELTVTDDTIPELREVGEFRLLPVPQALLPSATRRVGLVIESSDDPAGVLGFERTAAEIDETTGRVQVGVVVRSGGSLTQAAVTVSTAPLGPRPATSGQDYVGLSAQLTLAPGEVRKPVVLSLLDDDAPELDETLQLVLSAAQALLPTEPAPRLGPNASLAVTIRANDMPFGSFNLASSVFHGDEDSRAPAQVRILRTGGTLAPASVRLVPVAGTATGSTPGSMSSVQPGLGLVPVSGAAVRVGPAIAALGVSVNGSDYLVTAAGSGAATPILRVRRAVLEEIGAGPAAVALASARLSNGTVLVGLAVPAAGDPRGVASSYVLYAFDGSALRLWQRIPTTATVAVAHFNAGGDSLLAITNGQDASGSPVALSEVWRLDPASGRYALLQQLPTSGATETLAFSAGADSFALVLARTDLTVLRWDGAGKRLILRQTLPLTSEPRDAELLLGTNNGSTVLLLVAMGSGNASTTVLFAWDGVQQRLAAAQTVATPGARSWACTRTAGSASASCLLLADRGVTSAFFVDDGPAPRLEAGFPASTVALSGDTEALAVLPTAADTLVVALGPGNASQLLVANRFVASDDFLSAPVTVNFAVGETERVAIIPLVDDSQGEAEEQFEVRLDAPSGGAVLGPNVTAKVRLAPSDDVFGLFSFASAAALVTSEPSIGSMTLELIVQRRRGARSTVNVSWVAHGAMSTDFVQASGVLTFPDGTASRTLHLEVPADSIPELQSNVLLRLSVAGGGASVDAAFAAVPVTVLGSDSPLGAVGFVGPQSMPARLVEGATMTLEVRRAADAFGEVVVRLAISPPTHDLVFLAPGPVLNFSHASTVRAVRILAVQDGVPELAEPFNITLEVLTSPGPAVVPGADVVKVIVPENDFPFGRVEIDGLEFRPTVHRTLIVNITRTRSFVGSLEATLGLTVRPQPPRPAFASFSVSLSLTDGGRTSGQVSFQTLSGSVLLLNASLAVSLVGLDVLPSPSSTGATQRRSILSEHGPAQRAISVTAPLANGVLGLAMQETRLSEPATGAATYTIPILRSSGTYGVERLLWRLVPVRAVAAPSLSPLTGSLVFSGGSTREEARVAIAADDVPELEEEYTMELISETASTVVGLNTSAGRVVVAGSDSPHGEFGLAPSPVLASNVSVLGTYSREVRARVLRSKGLFGAVNATLRIAIGVAYGANHTVQVADGGRAVAVAVPLPRAVLLNLPATLTVELVSVALLSASADAPPVLVPGLSIARGVVATDPLSFGVVRVSAGSLVVAESAGVAVVEVERALQARGTASVAWRLVGRSALPGSDFVPASGTLDFAPGARVQAVPVALIADGLPELDEEFDLVLSNVTGGGILGAATATVRITANDNASGVFVFANASLHQVVEEPAAGSRSIEFVVERRAGAVGNVSVPWAISGESGPSDLAPLAGVVVFQHGERRKAFDVHVLADSEREPGEASVLRLGALEGGIPGQSSLAAGRAAASLLVPANGDPFGVFGLVTGAEPVLSPRPTGRGMVFSTQRGAGSLGFVVVTYSIGPSGGTAPSPGVLQPCDLQRLSAAACAGNLTFPPGVTRVDTEAVFGDDTFLSLGATVWARLLSVHELRGGTQVPATRSPRLGVGIELRFTVPLTLANTVPVLAPGSAEVRLVEPAAGAVPVLLNLSQRTDGYASRGSAFRLAWRVEPRPVGSNLTLGGSADLSPTRGNVSFTPKEPTVTIALELLADGQPEFEERYALVLGPLYLCASNASCVPTDFPVDGRALLVVERNGDPRGVLQFRADTLLTVVAVGAASPIAVTVERTGGRERTIAAALRYGRGPFDSGVATASSSGEVPVLLQGDEGELTVELPAPLGLGNWTLWLLPGEGEYSAIGPRDTASVTVVAAPGSTACAKPVCPGLANAAVLLTLPPDLLASCLDGGANALRARTGGAACETAGFDAAVQQAEAGLLFVERTAATPPTALRTKLAALLNGVLLHPLARAEHARLVGHLAVAAGGSCSGGAAGTAECSCMWSVGLDAFDIEYLAATAQGLDGLQFPRLLGLASFNPVRQSRIALPVVSPLPPFARDGCYTAFFAAFPNAPRLFPTGASTTLFSTTVISTGFGGVAQPPQLLPSNAQRFTIVGAGEPRYPTCAHWSYVTGGWDAGGCSLFSQGSGEVACECTVGAVFGVLERTAHPFPWHTFVGLAVAMLGALATCIVLGGRSHLTATDQPFLALAVAALSCHFMLAVNLGTIRDPDVGANGLFVVGLLLHFTALCYLALMTLLPAYLLALTREGSIDPSLVGRAGIAFAVVLAGAVVGLHLAIGLETATGGRHALVYGDLGNDGRLSFVASTLGLALAFYLLFVPLAATTLALTVRNAVKARQSKREFTLDESATQDLIATRHGTVIAGVSLLSAVLCVAAAASTSAVAEVMFTVSGALLGLVWLWYAAVRRAEHAQRQTGEYDPWKRLRGRRHVQPLSTAAISDLADDPSRVFSQPPEARVGAFAMRLMQPHAVAVEDTGYLEVGASPVGGSARCGGDNTYDDLLQALGRDGDGAVLEMRQISLEDTHL